MTDLGLRPRSATELVDAAFQVFRRAPVQFIVTGAVVYVPWLVIQLAFNLGIQRDTIPGLDILSANLIAALIIYVILGGAIAIIARDVYLERTLDVAAAYKIVAARFVSLLVASLTVMVMLTIGLLLLFFPVLYPLSKFFCVRQAVVLEGLGPLRALRRSSALSAGVKWHIIGTLLLGGVLTIVISIGAGLAVGLVQSNIVQRVVETLVGVCVRPFFSIVETLLYYDVRIRKEAFDIEYMAGGDSAAAPSSNVAI
jgi:hypothetical protein